MRIKKLKFKNWEEKVTQHVEKFGQMTRSDAQGFVEAHEDELMEWFVKSYSPAYVTQLLLNLNSSKQ